MKYCTKCGKEVLDEAVVCPGCGTKTDGEVILEEKNHPLQIIKKYLSPYLLSDV